ncbi:MAG: exodeoxyribonuclease VII large subunit [Alphaproteobacteria bacterium]|nr:exodeoxyribonuclease VII large subunit [Alphaproteobacteria bacterium]
MGIAKPKARGNRVSLSDTNTNLPELSVSELSTALKRLVEGEFGFVRVRGEISGYTRAASGHCYLSLKDDRSVIDAVMWKGTSGGLRFKPEDGMEVVCSGKLTTYPARSKYQLVIETMAPAGIGALLAQLEERRKKLAAEGLFNAVRKRPIPWLPEVIGVVTSPTGAVIRDILHRLADRFPRHVLLWPVLVQGEQAAAQVAAAIEGFNRLKLGGPVPRPDVIIVARGGGSIEDLWAFNEEIVVRAAAASAIPLISAVGHETDTTLIDFASDVRAPTPTAAAEIAVPVRSDLRAQVLDLERRRLGAQMRLLHERRARLTSAARGLPRLTEILGLPRQRFDAVAERLARALLSNARAGETRLVRVAARLRVGLMRDHIERGRRLLSEAGRRLHEGERRLLHENSMRLAGQGQFLRSLSHQGVLARGFTLLRDDAGKPVRRASDTAPGMAVEIEFQDGRRNATLAGSKAAPAAVEKLEKKPAGDGQGRLF